MTGQRPFFPQSEYDERIRRVRERMAEKGLRACLVSAPENVYYLTGLDHQGYFAFELLIVPAEGTPVLVTRAMEAATIRDQTPGLKHVGYSDGIQPLPPPEDREKDVVIGALDDRGEMAGIRPWSMSYGVATRTFPGEEPKGASVQATCRAIEDLDLGAARIGVEMNSSFLPYRIARGILEAFPDAEWKDASGLVDSCRMIQSPLELKCTREAAAISDSMMLAAMAAAGPGVYTRDVMAAVYDTMFRRGATYPGFIPLVRSTRTLEHEHGTWDSGRLRNRDILFLEMAGCVRRYHAPLGRLVFIGHRPAKAEKIHAVCAESLERAAGAIGPGVKASEVYRAWHSRLEEAGLGAFSRHHCGYSVGIGFPPSWSGSGTPVGLRPDSPIELQAGMVFHLMSWLLRTGRGDSFLSDTITVTESGCEFLTTVRHRVYVR